MDNRVAGAKIALIFHRKDRHRDVGEYAIMRLAEMWRNDGQEVVTLFGTRDFVPADLAILHVDLSVVPAAYVRFARRHPIALNERITDVRKSVHSRQMLAPGDQYNGPVIVKTDLNAAGRIERRYRSPLRKAWDRLSARGRRRPSHRMRHKHDYEIFAHPGDVPQSYRRDPLLVVEKFLPETTPNGYAVRSCHLLGAAAVCERSESTHPIVHDATARRCENVDVHPYVYELRRLLDLDYGKIDYTLHDGHFVFLDVNKTVAASVAEPNPALRANRCAIASGLYDFLAGRRRPA